MPPEFWPLAMPARAVVITRPAAQARAFAQRVAALGRQAIVFPLLEISPLPDQAPLQAALAELPSYALVAFVGPNAIDAAFNHLSSWPRAVAIAVMSDGSRKALAQYGVTDQNASIFSPRDPLRADSETLLAALDRSALQGKKALIVRGETGRELLADALRSAGVVVTQVAAYRRTVPLLDESARRQLLDLIESQNDWVVTSSEALRNLLQMAASTTGAAGVAKLQRQCLLVSHLRIAENAQKLGFINVRCSGSGDEQLLAAIQFDT
jgi:uroporphyrinogen-III synthase